MRKKKRRELNLRKKVTTPSGVSMQRRPSVAPEHGCAGCAVRSEMIEFLRMQNSSLMEQLRQMQEKFLALAGDAADRYHRIRMTEMAQSSASSLNGVQPVMEEDSMDVMMNEFINGFNGKGPQA